MSHWRFSTVLPILLMVGGVLASCEDRATPPETVGPEVFRPKGFALKVADVPLRVELAITGDEQWRGLMYRAKLDENRGMLFVYDDEARRSFWMKNTFLPLSIAFVNSQGVIGDIQDLKPEDETTIWSSLAARYALEVNQGWFRKHGIEVGAKVTFSPELEAVLNESR